MAAADTHFDTLLGSKLKSCPHLCYRKLQVKSDQGRVVLRGVVNTYYQKQMAQEILRRVDGVERIENQLEVTWTPLGELARATVVAE